jgi:hypothetical protein
MSRLTGADAYSLMEAYNNVYAPQELTEEQVWEEVETWVNSLIEEGYDLSDYTWEEMYESYIEEQGQRMTTGQATAPKVAPTPTSRPQVAGGGMGGMRGSGRDRNATQTSSSPGALRVPAPAATPYVSRFAGARDAAFSKARQIQGSPVVGPRVATPAAQAPTRTTTPPARTATPPAGGTTKPTAPATTTPPSAPSAPRPKDTSITDMIGRSQVRQGAPINTGSSTSDARAIAARSSVGATPKPAPSTATAKPTPRQARLNMEMEYDTFDTVLEYLVAEGYADTNEAALVIMANMSEEWRESILMDEGVLGAVGKAVGNYLNSPSNDPDLKRDPSYNPRTGKGDYKDPRKQPPKAGEVRTY